jgi:hypothetical protein
MRFLISLFSIPFLAGIGSADDRGFWITTAENALPAMKSLIVVKAGEPGPGNAKHRPVAEIAKYKELLKVPDGGPVDVYWQGKNGLAVRALSAVKLKEGEVKEIKISDLVGVVNFRGDNQPRAALVTIAPQDDPGPDEKGHLAIQTAKDYRQDLVVPEGFYSLWITPESGARPRKIVDRFRVQAGKSVQLD